MIFSRNFSTRDLKVLFGGSCGKEVAGVLIDKRHTTTVDFVSIYQRFNGFDRSIKVTHVLIMVLSTTVQSLFICS